MMNDYDLCDVWRLSSPDKRMFSRQQVVNAILKQSRIDFCLVSAGLCFFVTDHVYELNVWSDHNSFRCTLDFEEWRHLVLKFPFID